MGSCTPVRAKFQKDKVMLAQGLRKSQEENQDLLNLLSVAEFQNYSNFEFTIMANNLPRPELLHKADSLVAIFVSDPDSPNELQEIQRTEIKKNNANPIFLRTFRLPFSFQEDHKLVLRVYQATLFDATLPLDEYFSFIGEASFKVNQILHSTMSYVRKDLHNINSPSVAKDATVAIYYEELNQTNSMIQFDIEAADLDTRYRAFLMIERKREIGDSVPIYLSQPKDFSTVKNQVCWREFEIQVMTLNRGNDHKPQIYSVFEWNIYGKHRFLGSAEISMIDILANDSKSFQLERSNSFSGLIKFNLVKPINRYNFLDYILGGC